MCFAILGLSVSHGVVLIDLWPGFGRFSLECFV